MENLLANDFTEIIRHCTDKHPLTERADFGCELNDCIISFYATLQDILISEVSEAKFKKRFYILYKILIIIQLKKIL